MSTRESVEAKALRYITERRLRVVTVNPKRVFAECQIAGGADRAEFLRRSGEEDDE